MDVPGGVSRFWVQAFFLLLILVFCMVQLFMQAEDRAVYIALLSAICGNTVPTIKQKKKKDENQFVLDEIDCTTRKCRPAVVASRDRELP